MTVFPEILKCREFVNADEIAKGLSPFRPEEVAIEAGKIMLHRIEHLLEQKETFAIETTLVTRSYTILIRKAKNSDMRLNYYFFGFLPLNRQRNVWR